jgi:hypothetical protein
MNTVQTLLLGYALGSVPTLMMARLLLAWLGKATGVSPGDISAYADAADGQDDGESPSRVTDEKARVAETSDEDPRRDR